MAITLAQQVGVRSSGVSVVVPYASPVTAGSLLTLHMRLAGAALVTTVTDSAGNTWAQAVGRIHGGGATGAIWYAPNAAGSTTTVTITNTDPNSDLQCAAQEWTGCSTASPLIATNSLNHTNVSTHTAGAVTTNISTTVTLVNYAFASAFAPAAEPTGYTAGISTFASHRMYYKIATSTTTEDPQFTSSATEISADVIAMFSGGEAAPATPTKRRPGLLRGVW